LFISLLNGTARSSFFAPPSRHPEERSDEGSVVSWAQQILRCAHDDSCAQDDNNKIAIKRSRASRIEDQRAETLIQRARGRVSRTPMHRRACEKGDALSVY
jgi:hypothetical protein